MAELDMAFQVVASGGHVSTKSVPEMCVVFLMHISSLLVFSIFLGYVTDAVSMYMSKLEDGRSKVPLKGHVLILGWNESTIRLVCQLGFLRQSLAEERAKRGRCSRCWR